MDGSSQSQCQMDEAAHIEIEIEWWGPSPTGRNGNVPSLAASSDVVMGDGERSAMVVVGLAPTRMRGCVQYPTELPTPPPPRIPTAWKLRKS
jgi:hypothetical protein